jgi:hypothetical protein
MNVHKTIIQFLLVSFFAFSACGDSSEVEVSNEMQDFLQQVQGSYKDVSEALEKYSANEELKTHNITMYDLSDGKVVAREGDCYTVEFNAGITVRVYDICWKGKKISGITSKGIK